MNRLLIQGVLVLLVCFLTGCSAFDARWREAGQPGAKTTRWDGRWASGVRKESDGSPHGGRLRCVLEPREKGQLAAHFHANWLAFSGNYDMTLEPVPAKPQAYRGTHDLPPVFGGTYHYDAVISSDRFRAEYRSSYDVGHFDLRRVPPGK